MRKSLQYLKPNIVTAFNNAPDAKRFRKMLAGSREGALERKIGQLTMENDFLKKLLVGKLINQMNGRVRRRDQSATPSPIVLMSLQLVIPGGLLSGRAFGFTIAADCERTIEGKNFFRPGEQVLTSCLT